MAFATEPSVTLVLEDIQPFLDEVLKYVLAANRQFHLPPSIYHRADLTTEENRVSLVKYALSYAAECAQDALADMDLDDFDDEWTPPGWGCQLETDDTGSVPDELDTPDMHIIRPRRVARGKPRRQRSGRE